MSGKLVAVFITATWVTMMYGLMRDEVAPAVQRAREVAQSAGYEELEELVPESRVNQMGIYMGAQRVGRSITWIKKEERELTLRSETEINLTGVPALKPVAHLIGGGAHSVIRFRALAVEGRLLEFRSAVSSPPGTPPVVTVTGTPVGDRLHLVIRQFGRTRTETVPFDQRQFLSSAMAPNLSLRDLKVGKKWMIKSLDHTSYTISNVWAEVVGRQEIVLGGKKFDAFEIVVSHKLFDLRIWATADGEILKQQFLAFTFVREEPSAEAVEELSK